jgi:deazaflavin-dependent oxidoreductase (nitroreductase family)
VTAARTREARPVPRPLLRLFWALHRAIYRASDGRLGLQRPVTGQKFGMMRLTTIGRRSGRTRLAIVGYFEDGPNLVTLAMNGWGKNEPAWWLNLKAMPQAFVELAEGRRSVSARAATSAERDRLWATFADYPGWGEDLDRLAAHHDRRPEIVVLEPRGTGTGAGCRGSAPAAAASETDPPVATNAARTSTWRAVGVRGSEPRRCPYLMPATWPQPATHPGPRSGSCRLESRARRRSRALEHLYYSSVDGHARAAAPGRDRSANQRECSADSARLLMPFSIRRSMAKSPNSISTKLKIANCGVSHR